MKKILYILLLIMSQYLNAQIKNIDLTLVQDTKLAVMQDNYGNKPFTLDILWRIAFVDYKGITLSYSYELAMLNKMYSNRLFGAGYTYKNSQLLFEFGEINHKQEYYNSFGFNFKQDIKFYKRNYLSLNMQSLYRGDTDKWRNSAFVGYTFKIFN